MADKVAWLSTMDEAMGRAKAEGKPIFLDFFNPG
jgi:hypothetical protein